MEVAPRYKLLTPLKLLAWCTHKGWGGWRCLGDWAGRGGRGGQRGWGSWDGWRGWRGWAGLSGRGGSRDWCGGYILSCGWNTTGIGYMALWGFWANKKLGDWMGNTPKTVTTTRAPAVLIRIYDWLLTACWTSAYPWGAYSNLPSNFD